MGYDILLFFWISLRTSCIAPDTMVAALQDKEDVIMTLFFMGYNFKEDIQQYLNSHILN